MKLSKPLLALVLLAAALPAAALNTPAAALNTPAAAQSQPTPPTPTPPTQRTTMIGRYDHEIMFSKITVSDMVRSYRFYTQIIGLKLASPMMKPPAATDPEKDFVEFPLNFTGTLADPFFVLIKRRGVTPTPDGARLSVIGFKVPNLREAVDRAKAAGSTVIRDPGPTGALGYGLVTDPDGYTIEFIQAGNNPPR